MNVTDENSAMELPANLYFYATQLNIRQQYNCIELKSAKTANPNLK